MSQGMYTESSWSGVEAGVNTALAGDGTMMLDLADQYNRREQQTKSYDTSVIAFPAIFCADVHDPGLAARREQWKADAVAAPIFGKHWGPDIMCSQWPVQADPITVSAPTAPTILVVAATGDPATPYAEAPWLVQQLGNAVMITLDGPDHVSFGRKVPCLDDAVLAYYRQGTVPAPGIVCKP